MSGSQVTEQRILNLVGVSYVVVNADGIVLEISPQLPLHLDLGQRATETISTLIGMDAVINQLATEQGQQMPGIALPFVEQGTDDGSSIQFSLKICHESVGRVAIILGHDDLSREHEQASVAAANQSALTAQTKAARSKATEFEDKHVEVVHRLAGEGVRGRLAEAAIILDVYAQDTTKAKELIQLAMLEIDALSAVDALLNRPETVVTGAVGPVELKALGFDADFDAEIIGVSVLYFDLFAQLLIARFGLDALRWKKKNEHFALYIEAAESDAVEFEASLPGWLYAALCLQADSRARIETISNGFILRF